MAKILVVDDSPVEIKIIRGFLESEHDIIETLDGQKAIDLAVQFKPDLILLDVIMPEPNGFSVCRTLKSRSDLADIPVIFITAATNIKDIVHGFENGGQDYIIKPFYAQELSARIKVHLDLRFSKEKLQQYALKLEEQNQQLNLLMQELETAAMTDYITGLANRRSMMESLNKELERLKSTERKTGLVLCDIDNFKKINDTYGHECGDYVLKEVSGIMKSSLRAEDAVARWGGEEFLLLLPDLNIAGAKEIAENIRRAIERKVFCYRDELFSLTMTLAVGELAADTIFDDCIRSIDYGLYLGKNQSKNCVIDSFDHSVCPKDNK